MFDQLKRPQLVAPERRRPTPPPLKPATAPAMPMPSVFTRPLEKPLQKKQRKACPACEEEGTTCPGCQKKAAPTLERPPSETQRRGGSPVEDPAERQADELGKDIGEELKGTGSFGHGPLPKSVQDVAETHLGVNLEGTYVDAGSTGQKKAKDESALAVTEGKRIAFGEGQLDTSSTEGRNLLGHELVHVGQQAAVSRGVLQRRTAASVPPLQASMTESGLVARIRELKRQPGRTAEVAQLADELKKRCFRFAAKRMRTGDFLYSLKDGVHFVPASAAIHELDHTDARSISSCASALRLAVESAFAEAGAPRLLSYSVAVPGTPEHLWLKAAQAGHGETILRAWGHAVAAGKGAVMGAPGGLEPGPRLPPAHRPPILEEPRPPAPPEAPIEAPEVPPGTTTLPEVGPEPTSLLGELAAPLIAAIGTFVAIMLYARPTASRWASEMNPVTGRSYTNETEFEAVQAMTEEERAAARGRLLASEAGGQEEQGPSMCADVHRGMPECYEIDDEVGRGTAYAGYRHGSPGSLLNALKRKRRNPHLKPGRSKLAERGPCAGVKGSVHINVYDRGDGQIGSIVCCPCCTDEPAGPIVETRCAFVEHT